MHLNELVTREILTKDEFTYFYYSLCIKTVEALICRLPNMSNYEDTAWLKALYEEARKLVPDFDPDKQSVEKGRGALNPSLKVRSKETLIELYKEKASLVYVLEVLIDIRDALIKAYD